ncbi:MAG: hypothetical protein M9894_25085 [Planctomycetes bacterium]|nr:hypothetical protein [Planctomycetota bacterium]
MADEGLRRLEREAAQGDPQAAARLARERARVGQARAWALADTWPLEERARAHDVLFTPDGDLLLVDAKGVRSLDPSTGALRRAVRRAAWRVMAGVALWEGRQAPAGASESKLSVGGGIRVRPRVRLVMGEGRTSGGGASTVEVVNLPGLSRPRTLLASLEGGVDALAAAGDVVVAASGEAVRAWREGGGVTRWRHPERVRALAIDAVGRRVLVVGERTAIVRDPAQIDDVASLALDTPPLPTCAVTADGALAVTATSDAVHVWDTGTGQRVQRLPCEGLRRVTLARSGARSGALLAVHADRVSLLDVGSGRHLGTTPPVASAVVAAALDPTERLLVALNPTRVWTFRPA